MTGGRRTSPLRGEHSVDTSCDVRVCVCAHVHGEMDSTWLPPSREDSVVGATYIDSSIHSIDRCLLTPTL